MYRYVANCTLSEVGTGVRFIMLNRGWKLNSSNKCQGIKTQNISTPVVNLIASFLRALKVDDGGLP